MSSDPTILLRMLEPAVRPGGVSGIAPRRAADAPFEAKPFDLLLQEAKTQQADTDAAQPSAKAQTLNPLAGLADIAHIENASLRKQLEQVRAAAPHLLSDSPESPSPPE